MRRPAGPQPTARSLLDRFPSGQLRAGDALVLSGHLGPNTPGIKAPSRTQQRRSPSLEHDQASAGRAVRFRFERGATTSLVSRKRRVSGAIRQRVSNVDRRFPRVLNRRRHRSVSSTRRVIQPHVAHVEEQRGPQRATLLTRSDRRSAPRNVWSRARRNRARRLTLGWERHPAAAIRSPRTRAPTRPLAVQGTRTTSAAESHQRCRSRSPSGSDGRRVAHVR